MGYRDNFAILHGGYHLDLVAKLWDLVASRARSIAPFALDDFAIQRDVRQLLDGLIGTSRDLPIQYRLR
jgi:hypothetical protein